MLPERKSVVLRQFEYCSRPIVLPRSAGCCYCCCVGLGVVSVVVVVVVLAVVELVGLPVVVLIVL